MTYSPNYFGSAAKGSSRQTKSGYQNGTGSTMPVGAPVATNTGGQLILVDVSSEVSVEAMVGLAAESIPSAANGQIASDGRLEEIPLGLGFSIGDPIWVGVGGTLTKVKPDLSQPGWSSGYFVIFVGVVVKNEFDALKQDIQLCRQVIGQL